MKTNPGGKLSGLYGRIPPKLIDGLYLAAAALVIIYDYDFLTRFDRAPFRIVYMLGAALAGVVLCLRFLNIRNESKLTVAAAAVLILIGGTYFLARHSYYFLVLSILMAGALRVDAKKLQILYAVIAVLFFSVMVAHFLLTTTQWAGERNVDFGAINSTDCQSMIFFLVMAYLFIREKRISYIEILLMAAVVMWFWSHTHAELSMICSAAGLLIAAVVKTVHLLTKGRSTGSGRILGCVISCCFLVFAAFILVVSLKYDPDSEKWVRIDQLLHNRLSTPHKMILLYPPRLWGSEYVEVGWGYSPGLRFWREYAKYGYTFIDCSYMRLLVKHGLLVYAMILGAMTCVSWRYALRGKLYQVLLLAVMAADFLGEGHMTELACNIWLLLPFAGIAASGGGSGNAPTDQAAPR